MWKKVLYVAVALIFGFIVAIIGYNSNQYNNIMGLVGDALASENYKEIPMIFGGVHDTNPIVNKDEEKLDVVVFNGTAVTDLYYGKDSKERYAVYEKAYYIYLFKSSFSTVTYNENENHTAFVFTADNGNEYTYSFVADSNVNKDSYVETPLTVEDVLLKASRDLSVTQENWGFMSINLTETMVKYITASLSTEQDPNATITGMKILDNEGNVVSEVSVNFDFSQQFYLDINELVYEYNLWYDAYNKNEGVDEAEAKFNEFYEPWLLEFNTNAETTGYSFRHDDSYLSPTSILWQTVGMMAIYSLVVVMFYVMLFHFSAIRNIFSRSSYKDYSRKDGKKTTYIAPVRKIENVVENKEENKEETEQSVVENPQE